MKTIYYFLLSLVFLIPTAHAVNGWQSFISVEELHALQEETNVVLIDARSEVQYRVGHIPGAINVPGEKWRTPSAKPNQGRSQYVFSTIEGDIDAARYEALLSDAGVRNDQRIVVYGNHAGKTDGSVPAYILRLLGHKDVFFLDGIGVEQWQAAGYQLSTENATRVRSTYTAQPQHEALWSLVDVAPKVGAEDTLFLDTRSPEEFNGQELRSNKRGGHIPRAIHIDYSELLDEQKRVLPKSEVAALFASRGIDKSKEVVLYCQTATRVTLHALALEDLGYEKVSIYDASWHEYGNRPDTKIAIQRVDE